RDLGPFSVLNFMVGSCPKKGVWNFEALKTAAFIETRESSRHLFLGVFPAERRLAPMRTRLYLVIGVAILLLGPMQGRTQFPGGGGGGGGRGGGRGGFNMDPGARFEQLTNGQSVWVRSGISQQR